MSDSKLEILISAEQIRQRIEEMAKQIDADYPPGPLYLIGILKGSILFLSDLARALPRHARLDFIGISSYGKGKASSGEVKLTKDLDTSIQDHDVLIVEDIIDSGITLSYLINLLQQRKPRSIRIATLLDNPQRRQRPGNVHDVGFQSPDKFVVGYGLDFDKDYRNLR